jgi:hypothetical protein
LPQKITAENVLDLYHFSEFNTFSRSKGLLTTDSHVEVLRIVIHRHNTHITTLENKSLWEYKLTPKVSRNCWDSRSFYLLNWLERVIIFHYRFIQAVVKELRRVFYKDLTLPQLLKGSTEAGHFSNNNRIAIIDTYAAYILTDMPWAVYEPKQLRAAKNIADIGAYH